MEDCPCFWEKNKNAEGSWVKDIHLDNFYEMKVLIRGASVVLKYLQRYGIVGRNALCRTLRMISEGS